MTMDRHTDHQESSSSQISFIQYLEGSTEVVRAWPAWKQEIIGRILVSPSESDATQLKSVENRWDGGPVAVDDPQ